LALYVGGWGYPYCNGLVSTEMVISVQSDWHSVTEQFWDLISQIKFPWLEVLELGWL
jgi:hypothetical protein